VLMFNFGFFRLLFVESFFSGLIICLAYNIAATICNLEIERIVANNFFLVSALISGASVTYLLERLFRA
jgi:adenylate cyclase